MLPHPTCRLQAILGTWRSPVAFFGIGMLLLSLVCSEALAFEPSLAASLEHFEKSVRPILVEHCYECHSHRAEKVRAGLRLDSRIGALRGGDSGPAVVPHDAQSSLLVSAIRYEGYEMPPKGKLSEEAVLAIERWVEQGAVWPDEPDPTADVVQSVFDLEQRRASHWVWRPIVDPPVPTLLSRGGAHSQIDAFILDKLEAAKVAPASPIDRSGLIRRLYFDLIGLPPSPQQIHAFLNDSTSNATESVVDELLQSPHFGERWGRHWLDLVRYSESRGHEFDNDASNAFQYRDYVIRALNADVPYDQFVREHIAGDLLANPRLQPENGSNESILGTGFWFFGEWVHSPVDIRKDEADRFDNMIDVMSKTFLGVTVGCARCHDHKFDAISARDYYAFSGFLQSSDFWQVRFETMEQEKQLAAQLDASHRTFQSELRNKLGALLEKNFDSRFDPFIVSQESAESATEASSVVPKGAYRTLVDYRVGDGQYWMQNGVIFGKRPVSAGELIWEEEDGEPRLSVAYHSAARNDPFWNGMQNVSEPVTQSNSGVDFMLRSGRTLRSPTVELRTGEVYVQTRGSGMVVACVDSHRQVGGPLHKETIENIDPWKGENAVREPLRWHRMNLTRYPGHRVHFEFTPGQNAVLEILRVIEIDSAASESFGESSLPIADAEQSEYFREEVRRAVKAWRADRFDPSVVSPRALHILCAWIESSLIKLGSAEGLSTDPRSTIERWADERANLAQRWTAKSQLAMAMLDGDGEDDRVLIRGNASNPGPTVPRRFLEAVDGPGPLQCATTSGRLELADRLNAPENPLTGRVIVNRVWHHLLGRGIVPTPDDFGVLGQPPTHPELLDYLVCRFRDDGHSLKKLIRRIVLSQTYQMSGERTAVASERDPKNLLWHHLPPRRLEGEAIRDSLLWLAGNLDPKQYGYSVPIYLTDFMDGRGRPKKSGPSDGAGRRSIYVAVRRNFLSPFMMTFDMPSPFSTMGRRNVSNVPAQALIMMNDPFVWKQSQSFAARALQQEFPSVEMRIAWMYEMALGRPPREDELELVRGFVQPDAAGVDQPSDRLSSWSDFAHALINTKEFIYLR